MSKKLINIELDYPDYAAAWKELSKMDLENDEGYRLYSYEARIIDMYVQHVDDKYTVYNFTFEVKHS